VKPTVNDTGRPVYPDIEERIGEDPTRYLKADLDVSPRIRGMTNLGVVNGWLQVARDLDVDQKVIDQLERRQGFLVDRQRRIAADGGQQK